MKKTLLMLATAALVASAGTLAFKAQVISLSSRPDENDPELAATIRRMTNRSTAGLMERKAPKGGVLLALQDRFQDLALVKLDPEGDPAVGCVSSIDEANHFFGRNLETGEVYPSSPTDTEEYLRTKHAAPTDMTMEEFLFYKEMIRRAAPRLLGEGGSSSNSGNSLSSALTANTTVINIVNGDGPGEGFNDTTPMTPEGGNNGTTLGQQRLNLFNFAATIWASNIDSTVPINIQANFDPLTPCSTSGGVLGSAGTDSIFRDFPGAEFTGTWYPGALANKITGSDQDTTSADIDATFNSSVDTGCLGAGTRFYYGLDNTTPSQRVNLLVVLLHELGHGLGFQTFTGEDSNGNNTGAEIQGTPDIFERHIYDSSIGKFWNQMTDHERQISALSGGNTLWDGPNVDLASGFLTQGREPAFGRVQLFAPGSYQPGSSVSHWDTVAAPNLLMEPIINRGLALDLDLTKQQLRDIGWYRDVNGDRVPDTISNVTVSPNLLEGGSGQVTWVNIGGFAGNVSVDLSTDGGVSYATNIASNVSNTGSLTFTVPQILTTRGRIRVREYNYVAPVGTTTGTFMIGTASPPNTLVSFPSTLSVNEDAGHVDVPLVRTGDTSGTTTVDYATVDQGVPGRASQTSDYEISEGTLTFAPGETTKTFRILIVDDDLVEGLEPIDIALSNPTTSVGTVALGGPSTNTVNIIDNDSVTTTTNPYDDARFFVRQHYLDFLNREPDQGGWDFWTGVITQCGTDGACTEVNRINVSAAYFLSKEFQSTGYLAYLTHRSAFGATATGSPAPVLCSTFMHDVQELGKGYVDLQPGADQVLENNKVAYFNEFVARPEFVVKYPLALTNEQYVNNVLATANLPTTGTFRENLVNSMSFGTKTRATVLRAIAESSTIQTREFNAGFVTMEYFGYLRRDPDTSGFNFWLTKLNAFNGNYIQAEMVKAFIESTEDRQRFGTP
jgi:hypothetical protein